MLTELGVAPLGAGDGVSCSGPQPVHLGSIANTFWLHHQIPKCTANAQTCAGGIPGMNPASTIHLQTGYDETLKEVTMLHRWLDDGLEQEGRDGGWAAS